MCFIIDILSIDQKDSCETSEFNLCLYGQVNVQIGNEILSSNNDSEWVLTIAAYRLLHSLYSNHISGNRYPLIPCCGFFMISAQNNQQVEVSGCISGFDWTVLHYGDKVKLITENDTVLWLRYDVYKEAVIQFADKVQEVFDSIFKDFEIINCYEDYRINHYEAFRNEWWRLREQADIYKPEDVENVDISKCEYFSSDNIVRISKTGIICKDIDGHRFIDFEECAENYSKLRKCDKRNCIAEHGPGKFRHEYIFYTHPCTIKIFFKRGLKDLFKCKKTKDLNEFKMQINNLGWEFYDKI